MIRVLLLAALAGHAFAGFSLRDCDPTCREGPFGACMITKVEKGFTNVCYRTFAACMELVDPQSVCIDFVFEVKGNEAMWPEFVKFTQSLPATTTQTDEAVNSPPSSSTTDGSASARPSSTTTSTTTASSSTPTASSSTSGTWTPAGPTSTSTATAPTSTSAASSSTTILPKMPTVPVEAPQQTETDSVETSQILIVCIGLPALILLAVVFHLCSRRARRRDTFSETPLKLESKDFATVETEKLTGPTSSENTTRSTFAHL